MFHGLASSSQELHRIDEICLLVCPHGQLHDGLQYPSPEFRVQRLESLAVCYEIVKQAGFVQCLLFFTQDLKLPEKVFREAIYYGFNDRGIRGGVISDEVPEEAENLRDRHGLKDRKYE